LLLDVANNGKNGTTQCHSIFLLLESVVPWKIGGLQVDIQKFDDCFHFQDRPFYQCVVVIKPDSDDQEGFIDGYVGEETNHIETDDDILSTNINRIQQFYELAVILNEGIRSAGQRAQYIM
jgi:hypothetical protein